MREEVLNLKREFGRDHAIELEESYQYETRDFRDVIEWFYRIPAKYGEFYPHGKSTIAFFCTANRIKERILRKYKGQVELHIEGEDESILLFDKKIFFKIARIARAKRRRGRKTLSEMEKRRLVEAGEKYRFTGKSIQHTEPGENLLQQQDRLVAS